ncbi:EAL domain-containing protein [Aeromonas rivipollensis]|uniref:sensor domain-containing phosphodiesterase n=1 Tax=Aeromonas rivipollensis TaxID=948519 RepID=UPI00259D68A8|nr:GGDEF and EAL domain-containing protein [Aeromonas rivipollensis]MDM5086640.1 EAL domain-containing protein [Aeromonas rivipollensis]MDM5098624.1 EAL domain-containing protein [Aeromonas rivipollensis]MDM5107104.1 EAL domain-containing protein [Aeromonas rivipollensis]
MSSTALSHLPTASQAPLFFRLDTRSQRLVALTDVMQTPLHWLDEPRSAWPAQLPDALRQPIEQRLASGKGGKLLLRFAAQQWHIALSHEQDAFWLICLQTQPQESAASLSLQLPRLSQMASQQQYAPMLESLRECLGADRLILWHYQANGPLGSEQLTPVFTLNADSVGAIRGDSRYIRALRTRGALSFSEAAHQPMLSQHYYLANANVSSRLDGALLEQEKLIGVLSLEYAETTLIGEETLQLVRHCAQLLGHWQPELEVTEASPFTLPSGLSCKTGNEYCRALVRWAMTASGARIGWLGEFQLRGQDLWLIPRCVLEGETFSAVKPMRMEIGPGREIFQHGQSLYVEDLPLRYPQATQLLALNAKAYIGIPLQGQGGVPLGQITLLLDGPLADPIPLLDALYEQRERAAIELQRLANDDALRLAEVAFNTHDGLLVMDHGGIILKVNDSFSRITGFGDDEMLGQHIEALRPTYYGDSLKQEVIAAVDKQGYWLGEEQCLHKEGHLFPVRLMVSGVKDEEDEISHFVCSFHDITQEREAARHIERLAYYDDLCDLYNRRSLNDIMQRTLAIPNGQWGALLLLDLDNFKSINDSLGHACGDLLLQAVVVRLKSLPQENLVLARTSGDEFALLFTALGQGYVTAKILAEHFARELMSIFRLPFDIGDHKLHCSASVGISLFSDDDKDHLILMQQADTAVHMAKRAGQGNHIFFSEAMAEKEKSKLSLNNQLRDALRNNELVLHYQPQYRVDNGSLSGVEALLRWQKMDGTMIPPGDFIPIAEETTLIQEIGYWVMKTACAQYSFWLNNGLAIPHLSVNVSARQFHTAGFVQQVEYVLRDTGVPPSRLLLEVTESVVLENRLDSIAKIRQLKALGILISIDDFGTGYSSLAYLRDLPADEVKLDRSFIQTLVHSEQDKAIVKAILDLAKVFRFTVTAEGVEDEEQLAVLKALGCQHYQGFLTSRPLPVKALESLLGATPAG